MAVLPTNTMHDAVAFSIQTTPVAASGGGDAFGAGDNVFLMVRNTGGSTRTITVTSQVPCEQGGTHNSTFTVGAATSSFVGPFFASRWADANGKVNVTYDSATGVLVAAFAMV